MIWLLILWGVGTLVLLVAVYALHDYALHMSGDAEKWQALRDHEAREHQFWKAAQGEAQTSRQKLSDRLSEVAENLRVAQVQHQWDAESLRQASVQLAEIKESNLSYSRECDQLRSEDTRLNLWVKELQAKIAELTGHAGPLPAVPRKTARFHGAGGERQRLEAEAYAGSEAQRVEQAGQIHALPVSEGKEA